MSEFDINWSNKHNTWNLIWLPIVIIINIILLLNWTPFVETVFTNTFITYLSLDYVWLLIKPCSVSSPEVILFHHCVTIAGIATIPYVDQDMKYIIVLASLVEICTWMRLLKNVYKNTIIFHILFLISWVIIRLIIGPICLMLVYKRTINDFTKINILLLFVAFVLNVLSVIWTFQLIKVIKKRFNK